MGPEDWLALQYWQCQNPVYEVCMQKSLISDGLHNTWKEMTEQRGIAMKLRLSFTRSNTTTSWFLIQRFEFTTLTFTSLEKLHVQQHKWNYGKLPVSPSSIQTPLAIPEDSPCTSSQIYAVKSTPAAASMFAVDDTSCPLTLNVSDRELRHINCPNPSLKPRARELNLAIVSQFTPMENMHYIKIQKKESMPCTLRR